MKCTAWETSWRGQIGRIDPNTCLQWPALKDPCMQMNGKHGQPFVLWRWGEEVTSPTIKTPPRKPRYINMPPQAPHHIQGNDWGNCECATGPWHKVQECSFQKSHIKAMLQVQMNCSRLGESPTILLDDILIIASEAPWTTTEPIFVLVIVGRNISARVIGT